MTAQVAFIGDVHGHVLALETLLTNLDEADVSQIVLLGDYINKGPDSAAVIELLCQRLESEATAKIVPLLGNHERVFLESLDSGDVRPLLRMAGAPTILSYAGHPVGPAVHAALAGAVPQHHVEFLRGLQDEFSGSDVVARHEPGAGEDRYRVSAHVHVGPVPRVGPRTAAIDTGCGSGGGRLTALLWPSLTWIQADESGYAL